MITYHCNHCRDEIGSIIRITVDATGSDQPEHFCSITCLVEWAVTNRVDVPGLRPGAPRTQQQHAQDAVEHTCELCGRVGTRRYVQTETGWTCAPSSAEACARKATGKAAPPRPVDPKYAHRNGRGLPGTGDIPAKPLLPKVTVRLPKVTTHAPKPAAPPIPRSKSADVTARCQDCTRTFTLTGRVLRQAVELHELKHGHIVTVMDREVAS